MRQISLMSLTTGFALLAGGCGLFGGGTTTTQSPTDSPTVASPVVVSPDEATPGQGAATQPAFARPTVSPQTNSPKGILPPDLISSTDPNQRVKQVQRSRSDPFALLPTVPTVQLPPPPPLPPPPSTARPNSAPTGGIRSAAGGGGSGSNRSPGGGSAPVSSSPPRTIPVVPLPPQPTLARAVKVTGVVQVGSAVYAIVSAPNEPSSRYVQEGQRLSNGQILVRRIEVSGAEPKVVLEQYGVEIVRAVGEGGSPTGTPAAALNPAAQG